MPAEGAPRQFDESMMRLVFAGAATFIVAATFLSRGQGPVEWSLLPFVVLAFGLWAAQPAGISRQLVYLFGLAVPLALNIVESDSEVSMFLVVLTAAVIASFEPNRVVAVALLTTLMILILVFGLTTAISDFAWPNWLFGVAFAWGFGELAFRYSSTIDQLKHARSLVADQAALHERRRIARDVHDLVGHSLSVVMLHVTGARHLVRKDPDEAERALAQAEVAGRESLAEIRRTVGMLRDASDSPAAPLPSPDLSDVSSLVDDYLLGGVNISLDIDGAVREVEGAAALAGYRIIQEALTNASRHTLGSRVLVTLDIGEQTYELAVRNSGGEVIGQRNGSGFGLVSMRERAKSVGGLLIAGPTPDGWTVEATLPVASVEPTL